MPHPASPEPVRLVIWDLDETFWGGTLSEGGITWRPENAAIVIELSRRGIINSICSKNDPAPVMALLQAHKLADYFVFPSLSWAAKGQRLADLIKAVQLRPASVLFIDDNPLNRAEAQACVPGLQIADETLVTDLLHDPRLAGQPDPDLTRLAHYQLLARRHTDQPSAGADPADFLRESAIIVSIEHDIMAHLDRAIELINRTNQLNFIKSRLPEDPAAARAALSELLAKHTVQAGLLHVRDRYGDYGFVGLYIIQRTQIMARPALLQFAFSCRILGMGIDTWAYHHLGRPVLRVVGDVVSDVLADTRDINWITLDLPGLGTRAANAAPQLSYVMARGACAMRAILHYFAMVSGNIIEEFAGVRGGLTPLTGASILAMHALRGNLPAEFIRDTAALGFVAQDFTSIITNPPPAAKAVWLLTFTLEHPVPVFRHKTTGLLIPVWTTRTLRVPARDIVSKPPAQTGLDPDLYDALVKNFDPVGALPDAVFAENLRAILSCAT